MKRLISFVILSILLCSISYADAENKESKLIRSLFSSKCEPLNSDMECKRLGSLEERDDVTGEVYGFVICQRKNLNTGKWDVIIQSNIALGAGLTEEEAIEKASKAEAKGKSYFTIGLPLNPLGEFDYRRVEYRIYQEKGQPTAIELYVVMRDVKRNAKEPKTIKIAWPSS